MSSTGFTIHHLPYGVITTPEDQTPSLATAYENHAINLASLAKLGFLKDSPDRTVLEHALSVSHKCAYSDVPPHVLFSARLRLPVTKENH